MDRIYSLLEQHRLQQYHQQFLELGVEDEMDFIDGIKDEDLTSLGLTQVQKNRFGKLKDVVCRLGKALPQSVNQTAPVQKQVEAFCLSYRYPKCPKTKQITGLDPSQNTVEDLMLRIAHQEGIGNNMAVCLYTAEGMPLSDDPFFNTWSLKERHIENESELYAMFTPKENLQVTPLQTKQDGVEGMGGQSVRCHVMLKGDYEVGADLKNDTLADLRRKLSFESGIPSHVLHFKGAPSGVSETLDVCGVNEDSVVQFHLSSFDEGHPYIHDFLTSDVTPCVQQTTKGMSAFFSTLYAINHNWSGVGFNKVIAYIRKLTGCHALAQSLHQLMCRNETGTRVQKIAIVEGLYLLFRELLPSLTRRTGEKIIADQNVFEYSSICWAYLMTEAEGESTENENFLAVSLKCQHSGERLTEPVNVPGMPDVFEKSHVLQKIRDGERIKHCDEDLRETSLTRATNIEKIILSLPPRISTFPLWLSYDRTRCDKNFQVNPEKSLAEMSESLKAYPQLVVTPPLQLKAIGCVGPCLVQLNEDTLGVYTSKVKCSPQDVYVFDCLKGKNVCVNLDLLAHQLRDIRSEKTFMMSRMPKEAIFVLMDSSSSMSKECYLHDTNIRRIDAVKQLFYAFANRSMAYDFHHVIALVQFGSTVRTLHTFTEHFEMFKEHIDSLQAEGGTPLYDALARGGLELTKVKSQFPDCRRRILCLTDGNDSGSLHGPVAVAKKLMSNDIVLDCILLGEEENEVLHGISRATGGCCFKPETSKDAVKLFEMETVLSMEMRKPKRKIAPSLINVVADLTSLFASDGYDKQPEVNLPEEIKGKVTITESALKKKLKDSKTSSLMSRDKRILEELRSLHCDPHPYCTVYPSETDISFWKILMGGPPDTPYERGVFELYCQFGADYPVKPPLVRFLTPIYHCNVNSVGRICHNIFDRSYSAHITMKDILDAIYGLLIAPEPQDPLDSVLAEEYLSFRHRYEEMAEKATETTAGQSMHDMEEKLVGPEMADSFVPPHMQCPLTKKMFVDPVITKYGTVYERKAIEDHLKRHMNDPLTQKGLERADLKTDEHMKGMVKKYRSQQI